MFLSWRKRRARTAAHRRRQQAHAAADDAAAALVRNFPDTIWPAIGQIVSGYRPIGTEIDPTRLVETFHCEQARIGLPCATSKEETLIFRAWSPGDPLRKGLFSVEEPEKTAEPVRPSLVLVPLLAADRKGRRLGYGAGFYDRTLEALRAAGEVLAVGLCYDAQIVASVPAGRKDQRLDWIVTEKQAYRIAN